MFYNHLSFSTQLFTNQSSKAHHHVYNKLYPCGAELVVNTLYPSEGVRWPYRQVQVVQQSCEVLRRGGGRMQCKLSVSVVSRGLDIVTLHD